MSEHEFEHYLAILTRLMPVDSRERRAIGDELRAHLEDRLDDLLAQGVPKPAALRQALDELGDAAHLAAAFVLLSRTERRRWIMRYSGVAILASVVFALTLAAFWPAGPQGQAPALVAQAQAQAPRGAAEHPQSRPPMPGEAQGGFYGGESPTKRDPAGPRPRTKSALQEKLGKRIAVEFIDTPLRDVLAYLGDQAGVQMVVRDGGIETIQAALQEQVSLSLKDVQARTALQLVLEMANDPNDGNLASMEQDGFLLIAPTELLDRITEVRVYNCRDLLSLAPPTASSGMAAGGFGGEGGMMAAPGMAMGAGMPGMGMGGPSSGGPGGTLSASDRLIEMIQSAVESNTWESDGGTGTISEFNGLLVIKTSPRIHEKVADLLVMVREAAGLNPAVH